MCAPSHKKRGTIRGMPSPPEAGKAKTFKKGPAFRRSYHKTPTLLDRSLDHFSRISFSLWNFRMTCDIILGRTRRVRERHEAARIGARQGEPDAGCGGQTPRRLSRGSLGDAERGAVRYGNAGERHGGGNLPDLRRCGDPRRRSNLAWRAAEVFFRTTGVACDGLHITLEKSIPSQAGLGGGSSDAAAVLRGLPEAVRPGAACGGTGTHGHGVGQ